MTFQGFFSSLNATAVLIVKEKVLLLFWSLSSDWIHGSEDLYVLLNPNHSLASTPVTPAEFNLSPQTVCPLQSANICPNVSNSLPSESNSENFNPTVSLFPSSERLTLKQHGKPNGNSINGHPACESRTHENSTKVCQKWGHKVLLLWHNTWL